MYAFYNQDGNHLETMNPMDLHSFGKSALESESENDSENNEPLPIEKTSLGKKMLKKILQKNEASKNNKITKTPVKTTNPKRWTWDDDMIEVLLLNIQEYKNIKTFEGIDFEGDLMEMYENIRKMLADTYPESSFGPKEILLRDTSDMDQKEISEYRNHIERKEKSRGEGYKRVKAKVKEFRRKYKAAIDNGSRSGSSKNITEHLEILKQIWGGCPSVSQIPNSILSLDAIEHVEDEKFENDNDDIVQSPEGLPFTPQIKDNKRKHLETKISAHQREMLLIGIAREELQIKNENIKLMKQSIEQTQKTMNAMTDSMLSLSDNLKSGFELIAQSLIQSSQVQQQWTYPSMMSMTTPPHIHSNQFHQQN